MRYLTLPMIRRFIFAATLSLILIQPNAVKLMANDIALSDLCTNAIVSCDGTNMTSEELNALVDANPATGIDQLSLRGNSVEIEFRGQPPWVNKIRVIHDGEFGLDVKIRNIFKEKAEVEFTKSTRSMEDGHTETVLECNDMRMTALILEYDETHDVASSTSSGKIYEVESYFVSIDPDNGKADHYVRVEWINNFSGKPCGGSDLSKRDDDAADFRDKLHNKLGWTRLHTYGNAAAASDHFGLNENSYADEADFVYFSGHGGTGYICFSYENSYCSHYSIDCQFGHEYGNNNMEWIAFSSCQTLYDATSIREGWHGCMDKLHLILGWASNSKDRNFGKVFGRHIAKHKDKIVVGFEDAARSKCYDYWYNDERFQIFVIAEETDNLDDHVWGAGSHSDDPTHDSRYTAFTCVFYGTKESDPNAKIGASPVSIIDVPRGRGPTIILPKTLVGEPPDDSMPRLLVQPRTVDASYLDGIASSFCANQGFFCDYQSEYDPDEGEWAAYDGQHDLRVYAASGGWEYTNTVTYCTRTETPPSLLTPTEAHAAADAFWDAMPESLVGVLPVSHYNLFIGLYDEDIGGYIEDSSWNISMNIGNKRLFAGYPIVGPGAQLEVVTGDGGELQSAYFGGWRNIQPSGNFAPITLEDALNSIAASGSDICIGGMPLCDTFIVDTSFTGYYEESPDIAMSEFMPVYVISGWCVFEGDTSAFPIVVRADYPAPTGQILSPSQDTTVAAEDAIFLQGIATNGTPPYEYFWFSDLDGPLGNRDTLTVSGLSAFGYDGGPAVHTITLRVTDANTYRDLTSVAVTVVGQYVCGDADASSSVDIDDIVYLIAYIFAGGPAPNPLAAGDADCSGAIDIDDVVYLISYIFSGGYAPCDTDGNGMPDC